MKKAIIVLSIVAVVGTGAYFFYSDQVKKLSDMDYDLVGVSFEGVLDGNVVANVKIKMTSKATFQAQVTQLNLDVFVNGIKIGNVSQNAPFIIPAKGYSIIDLKVVADTDEIKQNALNIGAQYLFSNDAILTLKGPAKVQSAFVKFTIPVNYNDSIKSLV